MNELTENPLEIYVIIVTLNMIDGLEKTLESLIRITHKLSYFKFRAIIINGNPFDDVHFLVSRYPDLVYKYIAENDTGIYDAMNKGISHLPSVGYSIFINSDDELLHVPKALIQRDFDVFFCNVISYDRATGLHETFKVSSKKCLNSANLLRPRIHHQGCFVRSSVLKQYTYDLSVGIRADVYLMGLLLNRHSSNFLTDTVALITTGGKSDNYNISNLISFFYVAKKMEINRIAMFIFSFPEILRYALKIIIGKRGVFLIRKVKFLLTNSIN